MHNFHMSFNTKSKSNRNLTTMSFSPEFLALTLVITNFIRYRATTNDSLLSNADAFDAINAVINNIHLFCNEYYVVNDVNKRKIINLLSIIHKKAITFTNITTCSTHARLFRKQAKFIANTLDSLGYSTDAIPLRRSSRH